METRRGSRLKLWMKRGAILGVVALIVAGWLGYQPALARYHEWKQARALRQAKEFISKHDAANAQLALAVALTGSPAGIETWRTAAVMLDQAGAPQALRLHQHIVQMMGANLSDKVALIESAIRLGEFNAARDELGSLSPEESNQPAALGAALSFAMDTNDRPVADALLDRLRAVAPNNDEFKVSQAMLHLRHPNAATAAAARRELEGWSENRAFALRVKRALMSDAELRRDLPAAKRWAAAVVADPQSVYADRLNQANLELLVEKQPFAAVYGELAADAAKSPDAAAQFASWLNIQKKVPEADHWIDSLPPEIRDSRQVLAIHAEIVAQLNDWDRLTRLLAGGAWGPISEDTVRLAMSARLVGSHGGPAIRRQVWDEALQGAGSNLGSLVVLQRLSAFWGWLPESEAALWMIARQYPDQVWADQTLFNAYRTAHDTASMRDVMNLLRSNDPGIPRYQHDWALLSLLTNPTETWDQPKRVLQRLYEQKPHDSFYVTSYAFALAQAGKEKEALALITALPQLDRDYTPRQPYLAYIYGLNRQRAEVDRAEVKGRGTDFLPEEANLFLQAHAALDRRLLLPPKPAAPKPAPKPATKRAPAA
ncbi:MAG TPA: hypothetical protein VHC86_00420 [Opitutaceae bacterium]|nr:hypothetical protein [Opitutaceae bacterium]